MFWALPLQLPATNGEWPEEFGGQPWPEERGHFSTMGHVRGGQGDWHGPQWFSWSRF